MNGAVSLILQIYLCQIVVKSPNVYANPVNWTDPSGLLTCEAPQAGCAQWVQDALNAIENVPLPIGKQLVQALWAQDRSMQIIQAAIEISNSNCSSYINPVNPSNMPGFTIKFTESFPIGSGFADMATRSRVIYIKTHNLTDPDTTWYTSICS